ncbi:MAG: hypothetical protein NBV57_05995 [Algoriphagus sp.]|nr:hypothetical protein [Algoriphagus sp.]
MLNKKLKTLSIFNYLIWRNKALRSRIIFIVAFFPLFVLLSIYISQLLGVKLRVTYMLIFFSGMFYHFFVTVFSMSAIYSYLKFLLINRLLLKIFTLIYSLGMLVSMIYCSILIGLSSVGQFQFEVGQVIIAFLLSNFIFAPLGIWISSFDFVKINLFEKKNELYQPRPIYLATAIVFLLIFSLLLDAQIEFEWQLNTIGIFLFCAIVIIMSLLIPIFKSVHLNFQKSIAE